MPYKPLRTSILQELQKKLIQHAKWKLLSKHSVWTRDVATLFGNLLNLDVETKGKEKVPERALQGTQNAETEMKTDVSDQALQGTQNTQNESFSNLNPSPNTHNNTVPAPQNQQPRVMNVTAPPGSQPGANDTCTNTQRYISSYNTIGYLWWDGFEFKFDHFSGLIEQ